MIRAGSLRDVETAARIWEAAHERRLGFVPEGARKEIAMSVLAARLALTMTRLFIYEEEGLRPA